MKFIAILLFLNTACFAQANLTAYRLVNIPDDGPCAVQYYVNSQEYFPAYVTVESSDAKLIDELLTIKMLSKKWKKKDFHCSYGNGDMIYNMYIIKNRVNTTIDTIFTTKENDFIVFPKNATASEDKNHLLKNTLTGRVKEFFEYDFDKQITSWFTVKVDSITRDKVLYKGKSTYGLTEELFKKQYTNKRLEDERSYHAYSHDANTYLFFDNILKEVTIKTLNSNWVIDGIQTGDNESVLLAKYPNSAKAKIFNHIRFEDIKREYCYSITLRDDKGSVDFFIKDKIIEKIIVSFYYH